ncbi:class IV lanthionine synthetase LanL [Streptomyces sp. MI02-7b]|uniref:class IV lanthionine synthetase LanL n=1 Tax=Streptomyces sp. MI02-7b TaxID=462941 RepID=UPI0029BC0B1B|nr:class IV lanthionine synthetase LanL [Streptomyces sp. MI02-7b]MDX3078080.1 class IV lanthionine synthetase LanL [Streptomyces sp. MI02-7b]
MIDATPDLVRVSRAHLREDAWLCTLTSDWHFLAPVGHQMPPQGWKIHISSVPRDAATVLDRVAALLVERGIPFKHLPDEDSVRRDLGRSVDRATSGKFITAYPASGSFREAVQALHEATVGLSGPRILSDRRFHSESLVHYRYGRFTVTRTLADAGGGYEEVLVAPDGSLVPDPRHAWFEPPWWAADPFPVEEGAEESAGSGEPLLAGRYRITGAIRHTNRGGVFRAIDQETNQRVVVKQARSHIEPDGTGRDARDALISEASVLRALRPEVPVPHPVDCFEASGDRFLVTESVDGMDLERRVAELRDFGEEFTFGQIRALGVALCSLVARVHAEAYCLVDLSPSNLMVLPDGGLRLVDLETATPFGQPVPGLRTPGYAAPERCGKEGQVLAGSALDAYSVGGILAFLCLRQDPAPAASDDGEADGDRLIRRLRVALAGRSGASTLLDVIQGLLRSDPAERLSLDRAQEELCRASNDTPATLQRSRSSSTSLLLPAPGALLSDTLRYLARTAAPQERWLWAADPAQRGRDPRTVHVGSSGPATLVARAATLLNEDDSDLSRALFDALPGISRWFDRSMGVEPETRLVPGLYSGHAGLSWAAYEVADACGDTITRERALDLALHLPTRWPNPDAMDGLAGTGMTLLHLGTRSGERVLLDRAGSIARVLAGLLPMDGEQLWPVPSSSAEDGRRTYYGFAHGAAGIGTFLADVARELEEPELLAAALRAGEALLRASVTRTVRVPTGPETSVEAEAAWWPAGPHIAAVSEYWCHGSSGVGTFMARLWEETRDDRFLTTADQAAAAVAYGVPFAPAGACHGLAGQGHFLLDMAELKSNGPYLSWAEHCAAVVSAQAVHKGDRHLVAFGESGADHSHASGAAGSASFLLRLLHGGGRPWTPHLT